MRVEFLRDWKWFRKGQHADLTKGRADLLCKRRLCKPAPLPAVKAEPVASAPAEAPKPKRKRRNAVSQPQKAD